MNQESFDIIYSNERSFNNLVVDKKIQQVVDELINLPHAMLIRFLTYWSDAIDNRKYVVESDMLYEEWFSDCCDYAASQTDAERQTHAKCMAQTLGHMLQDIKCHHPNKYPAAMRTVRSWKKYRFIGFSPTLGAEIDQTWIEPASWEDGKAAAQAYAPLLETFMCQYKDGKMDEAVGNRLFSKDAAYFEPDRENHCSFYEFLLEAVCHILALVMRDKRTEQPYRYAMIWHICTINMLYKQIFDSSFTCFEDLMYGDVTENIFVIGYDYLVKGPKAFE